MHRFRFHASFHHPGLPGETLERFMRFEKEGLLGFLDLPRNHGLLQAAHDLAGHAAELGDTLLVCGIGGSSLGLRALLGALTTPASPRVLVLESPDSRLIRRVRETCDPRRTCLAVITKSGGTAETLSLFMALYPWLGDDRRVFAITDPTRGDLRRLATDRGWRSLPVPPAVGGRFSVLSPVGLFPGAFAGIPGSRVLNGAEAVLEDFRSQGSESLAGRVASAYLHTFHARPVHVMMPYSDGLFQFALWFAQLWAESLGKALDLNGAPTCTGQTPLACRGPADQHSLVQLFMEGPQDKVFTLIGEEYPEEPGPVVPGPFADYPSMACLEGRDPDALRKAEEQATGDALQEKGLPVCRLRIPSASPETLGSLFMLYQLVTVLTGLALNINPLDQPGVERGKVLTLKAMGGEGH